MREIKFRAWDCIGNSMWDWDYLKKITTFLGKIIEDEFITVMQFTGLKDKNGKEIYEGDIIKYTEAHCVSMRCDLPPNTYIIEEVTYGKNGNHNVASVDPRYSTSCSPLIAREVIGNIYENPELLEGD